MQVSLTRSQADSESALNTILSISSSGCPGPPGLSGPPGCAVTVTALTASHGVAPSLPKNTTNALHCSRLKIDRNGRIHTSTMIQSSP